LDAANQKLRQANEKLAELDRAKTVFFSNISHEFRTPLTLLLGPLEDVLGDTQAPLSPHQHKSLQLIHHNALRLLKLVNALLDFSRIEAGRSQATFTPTDLSQLTREFASAFQSAVEKAGLRLVVECMPLSEPAYIDRDMWEKIVLNLVSNAFKFTFQGEIILQLSEDANRLIFSVQDTGIGIPQDQLPYIFDRFHRVEGVTSRSYEGTGIGLSLVQELVKLHGGTISVDSSLNAGTTFTVAIPKGTAHLPPEAIRSSEAAVPAMRMATLFAEEAAGWLPQEAGIARTDLVRSDGRMPGETRARSHPARILLADDNPDLLTYIAGLLTPQYEVEAVADGQVALERARVQPPALIVSDVMMPHLDGFGLLKALRAHPETRTIPVILLSARAGEEAAVEGLEAGADDYLMKPFSARELLARVRTHLELAWVRREWAQELEQANKELEAFSYSVSHDLQAPLRVIDGFSAALLEDYAGTLDAQAHHYLQRIRENTKRMIALIGDLLHLSRVSQTPLQKEPIHLTELARRVVTELSRREPARQVAFEIAEGLTARGDPRLLLIVLENLLGHAWTFTAKQPDAHITFGREEAADAFIFYIKDNGAGFDMAYADRLFGPFQRLHSTSEFEGTGIGLATVRRIITRHGGRIWPQADINQGATFFFTLGDGQRLLSG
jgi:signal transduction histidine kinase